METENKRNLGQYFTKGDSWLQPQVKRFIDVSNKSIVVDPFAGAGDIFNLFPSMKSIGFDIDKSLNWVENNSLVKVPKVDDAIVITNPPYLAKNSANKNKLEGFSYFSGNEFQDLYQIAIDNVIKNYYYSVFIIPETFINSGMFKEHISSITIVEDAIFDDTACPVCVCCFERDRSFFNAEPYDFYKNDLFLFDSDEIDNRLYKFGFIDKNVDVCFNTLEGNLGLRGVDGTSTSDRIRFCLPEDLDYDVSNIKISSRAITLIKVDFEVDKAFIKHINNFVEDYRQRTHDVFLSPFKNNNKLGNRRRRLDFGLAKEFIYKTVGFLKLTH